MKVILPPNNLGDDHIPKSLFLAGSIEMGTAVDWQQHVINAFDNYSGTILNPRRNDWDSSWKQTIDNLNFNEQVNWELTGLEVVSNVLFYFDPNTKSPITLMELGLIAGQDEFFRPHTIVVCPEGFWRKGNVDIVCKRYGVPQAQTLDEALELIKSNMLI